MSEALAVPEKAADAASQQSARPGLRPLVQQKSWQFHQLAADQLQADRVSIRFAAWIGHDPDLAHAFHRTNFACVIADATIALDDWGAEGRVAR